MPRKVYKWSYSEIVYSGSGNRPVSLHFTTNFGEHYNGTRTYFSGSLSFKRTKYYALSADMSYNNIAVTDTTSQKVQFTTREYGGRVSVDLNTRLSSSVFIQYNNQSHNVSANFRIHYIPRVGSDIYIVYNHTLNEEFDYRTEQNAAMLKVNYTYRL
jgi:hypothetical protein